MSNKAPQCTECLEELQYPLPLFCRPLLVRPNPLLVRPNPLLVIPKPLLVRPNHADKYQVYDYAGSRDVNGA